MLHHGHAAKDKMEIFRWPGMYREIKENYTSCKEADKILKTQIPSTEVYRLKVLTEPNQKFQLDYVVQLNPKHAAMYIF